jgi:hypothetical protein
MQTERQYRGSLEQVVRFFGLNFTPRFCLGVERGAVRSTVQDACQTLGNRQKKVLRFVSFQLHTQAASLYIAV